jgi:hypothetical protein
MSLHQMSASTTGAGNSNARIDQFHNNNVDHYPEYKIEIATALLNSLPQSKGLNQRMLVFQKGEKILIDRNVKCAK